MNNKKFIFNNYKKFKMSFKEPSGSQQETSSGKMTSHPKDE
jgi:hypothetical protein